MASIRPRLAPCPAPGTGPLPHPTTHGTVFYGWSGGGVGRCRREARTCFPHPTIISGGGVGRNSRKPSTDVEGARDKESVSKPRPPPNTKKPPRRGHWHGGFSFSVRHAWNGANQDEGVNRGETRLSSSRIWKLGPQRLPFNERCAAKCRKFPTSRGRAVYPGRRDDRRGSLKVNALSATDTP